MLSADRRSERQQNRAFESSEAELKSQPRPHETRQQGSKAACRISARRMKKGTIAAGPKPMKHNNMRCFTAHSAASERNTKTGRRQYQC
jgi:hypothetical protein